MGTKGGKIFVHSLKIYSRQERPQKLSSYFQKRRSPNLVPRRGIQTKVQGNIESIEHNSIHIKREPDDEKTETLKKAARSDGGGEGGAG